jgi:uncharacterized GH25 family protein
MFIFKKYDLISLKNVAFSSIYGCSMSIYLDDISKKQIQQVAGTTRKNALYELVHPIKSDDDDFWVTKDNTYVKSDGGGGGKMEQKRRQNDKRY